jgi:hypothetical protein
MLVDSEDHVTLPVHAYHAVRVDSASTIQSCFIVLMESSGIGLSIIFTKLVRGESCVGSRRKAYLGSQRDGVFEC